MIYFFLISANLIGHGMDISKYFRVSLDYEITSVDCALKLEEEFTNFVRLCEADIYNVNVAL